jgi:hypothetical protein
LYNVAEESPLKSGYWKARAFNKGPYNSHSPAQGN